MNCPSCEAALPVGSAFCHSCGTDLVRSKDGDRHRRHSFAASPGQSVYQFDIVTSLMPLASERAPQTYRFALLIAVLIPTVGVLLGLLPAAFVAAALIVPVVYLVYIYDVNEWEDQPIPVVIGTVVSTGVFAVLFTLLANEVVMPDLSIREVASNDWRLDVMLITCLLVPIGGEILRQIGPAMLARRPAFDDLIDGVTFGIAAGVAWAAVETIVLNRSMITGPSDLGGSDVVQWWIQLINLGLVKPIVFGSATAIAMAQFSGVGAGYAGFGKRYVIALLEAMGYGIVFQIGLYTGDRVGGQKGALLALAISIAVALVVLVRVRLVLHHALLEAALDSAKSAAGGQHLSAGEGYCGNCDMPLLPGAGFCSACGSATRAVPKLRRNFNSDESAALSSSSEVTTS